MPELTITSRIKFKDSNLYDVVLFNCTLESALEFKKLQITKRSEYQKAIEREKMNLIDLTRQLTLNGNKDLKINKKMISAVKRIESAISNMERCQFIESLATKTVNYIKEENSTDEIYNKILHLFINKIRIEFLESEEVA